MTTWTVRIETKEGDARNAAEIATFGHLLGMAVAGWNVSVIKSGGTVMEIKESEP